MGLQAPPTESIDSVKELILSVNENQRTCTHRDKQDKKHRKRKSNETSELPPPPPPQQPRPPPMEPSPEEILNMQSMHLHNLLFQKRLIEAAIEEANSKFIAMRIDAPQDTASKRIVYMIMDDGKLINLFKGKYTRFSRKASQIMTLFFPLVQAATVRHPGFVQNECTT
jgi:hypothetical protein